MHALKIENLLIEKTEADQIVDSIHEFLLDLGYDESRIEELECRPRSGFSPYSHNHGGLGGKAFADQECALGMGGTGFENADATIELYYEYDLRDFEKEIGRASEDWKESDWDGFYEYRRGDDQSTVMYAVDVMHEGINEGVHSLSIRLCVCVKDAPYHREYDDLVEVNLEFKTVSELKDKLNQVLKRDEFKQFSNCLREAY